MKFNNKENPCLDLKGGGKIWKSRNVAVSVKIIDYVNDLVLLVKRGEKMTHASKWCFPCGYLDWDETIEQAALREIYEETGYIFREEDLEFEGVDSDPTKFGQNVSMMFVLFVNPNNPDGFSIDKNWVWDKDEVADIEWWSVRDLPDMAFDHKERVREVFSYGENKEGGEEKIIDKY